MNAAQKTVLVVDDEPTARTVLLEGLPRHLERFTVASAANGAEAVAYLREHPVDVLVTDVRMPVMDGFELLAHVRKHYPNLPVVVLSTLAPEDVLEASPALGILRVVRKPASAAEVARHVREADADTVKGRMRGVALGTLLDLMQRERKTCSLLVRSGEEKGRLHFLSGELVNAYAFSLDLDGEAAARHLLGLDVVTIDFERSLHNHDRRIHTPLATLLLEVATQLDESRHRDADEDGGVAAGGAGDQATRSTHDEGAAGRGDVSQETVASGGLDGALSGLHRAVGDLRSRSADTVEALTAAGPSIEQAAARLHEASAGGAGAALDDRRIAEAWREVAAVAERLARTAEALATGPDHAEHRPSGEPS